MSLVTKPASYFLRRGNMFRVTDSANLDIRDHLPAGTFQVMFDGMANEFYLEDLPMQDIPGKRYGSVDVVADRIIAAFLKRGRNTGILMNGEKGSGKTMTSRRISEVLRSMGMPTLIVSNQFAGVEFNAFMASINQPCMVLFDEFEKVYTDEKAKGQLLSLLDGVVASNKLMVLTSNSDRGLNNAMINRPGRLLYRLDYHGVEEAAVREYCADNLINKDDTYSVIRVSNMVANFNFDMLVNLVEEMNRFNENALQCLRWLNIRPEFAGTADYKVNVRPVGNEAAHCILRRFAGCDPMLAIDEDDSANIEFYQLPEKYELPEGITEVTSWNANRIKGTTFHDLYLTRTDVKEINRETGAATYEKEGFLITLTPSKRKRSNYLDYVL